MSNIKTKLKATFKNEKTKLHEEISSAKKAGKISKQKEKLIGNHLKIKRMMTLIKLKSQ